MTRLKYVFLAIILLLPCAMFFGCGKIEAETAICKIDEVSYESLAEAISASQDGDTIKVYNDCIENVETLTELDISFKVYGDKVYAQYKIEKNISIEGIGSEKPIVFGSFTTELNDKYNSYEKITISNLEIVHSNIDSEFNYGVLVIDGSVKILDNNIHFDGAKDDKNNYGVLLTRKNGNFEHSQNARKLSYNVSNNIFGEYNSTNVSSAIAVFEGGEKYGTMSEDEFNFTTEKLEKTFLKDNSFSEGNLIFHQNMLTGKVLGLATRIKENMQTEVEDTGVLMYDGNLVFDSQADINLFCETIINGYVKNVNFFAKTTKAKIKYDKENSSNVTYKPITEL